MNIKDIVDVKVPQGWRLLEEGEVIKAGDRYTRDRGHSWRDVNSTGGKWNDIGYWPTISKEQSNG